MLLKTYYHPELQKTFHIDVDLSEKTPLYTISVVYNNALIVVGQYRGDLLDTEGNKFSKAELLEAFLEEYYTPEVEDKVEKEIEKKEKRKKGTNLANLENVVFDLGDC